MIQLYKNIKEKRLLLGMTQTDLAKKLGYSDKSMIAKIEKGQVDLPQSKILDFAKALDVSPGDLMGWEDETQNELTFVGNIVSSSNQKYIPFVPDVIAAGIPSTIEGIMQLDTIAVPFEFLGKHKNNKNLIAMKVSGESMNKIIPNGSYIIMRTDIEFSSLKDGDIVVFDKEHEYSLKHFYKTEDKLIFRPNSTEKSFVDITYDINDKVNIRGKVISHIVFDE